MAKMDDQRRNLNPTPAAVVAMNIYGDLYGAQRGGSMDFWDKLDAYRKRQCEQLVEKILEAHAAHSKKHSEPPVRPLCPCCGSSDHSKLECAFWKP